MKWIFALTLIVFITGCAAVPVFTEPRDLPKPPPPKEKYPDRNAHEDRYPKKKKIRKEYNGDGTIVMATWNLRQMGPNKAEKIGSEVAKIVQDMGADIIAFQEVRSYQPVGEKNYIKAAEVLKTKLNSLGKGTWNYVEGPLVRKWNVSKKTGNTLYYGQEHCPIFFNEDVLIPAPNATNDKRETSKHASGADTKYEFGLMEHDIIKSQDEGKAEEQEEVQEMNIAGFKVKNPEKCEVDADPDPTTGSSSGSGSSTGTSVVVAKPLKFSPFDFVYSCVHLSNIEKEAKDAFNAMSIEFEAFATGGKMGTNLDFIVGGDFNLNMNDKQMKENIIKSIPAGPQSALIPVNVAPMDPKDERKAKEPKIGGTFLKKDKNGKVSIDETRALDDIIWWDPTNEDWARLKNIYPFDLRREFGGDPNLARIISDHRPVAAKFYKCKDSD